MAPPSEEILDWLYGLLDQTSPRMKGLRSGRGEYIVMLVSGHPSAGPRRMHRQFCDGGKACAICGAVQHKNNAVIESDSKTRRADVR